MEKTISIERMLHRKEVMNMVHLSYPTLLSLEAQGRFPKRRQITDKRVGWVLSEITDWIRSRPVACEQQEAV